MSNAPRIEFSYQVFWTKQALAWSAERRAAVLTAVAAVLAQPDFEPNAYARQYHVPGLDDSAHAGASLTALAQVLRAFAAQP
ncbi:MAG: hypothetical protein KA764_05180 [Anaerolineales bacterium]|nr:hypothetical protein [Anaerolineales bacterium]